MGYPELMAVAGCEGAHGRERGAAAKRVTVAPASRAVIRTHPFSHNQGQIGGGLGTVTDCLTSREGWECLQKKMVFECMCPNER